MSYTKRLTNAALGRVQAFRMCGSIGMSTSSLHRESTDPLILILFFFKYVNSVELLVYHS